MMQNLGTIISIATSSIFIIEFLSFPPKMNSESSAAKEAASVALEKIQLLLQAGCNDSSSSDDEFGEVDTAMPQPDSSAANPPVERVKCTGEGGCGGEFPRDQYGSEFEFSQLCADCYQKSCSVPVVDVKKPATVNDDIEIINHKVSECGRHMGLILSNLRDAKIERYDVKVGEDDLAFDMFINHQDNVTKKAKKFWSLHPNPTPLLYGFKHYHAFLNTASKRGWLGHCRLSSSVEGAEGHGFVLWEFWETRCIRPRIDGIVIDDEGDVTLIDSVEKWLVENSLSSDTSKKYDCEFF